MATMSISGMSSMPKGLALMRKILITGGAGFIGSALVRYIINETSDAVVVVDKLTYAGNLMSLAPVAQKRALCL